MANVAIMGFGTVGSGVAEVIRDNNEHISQRVFGKLNLKYILDVRDFPNSPFADLVIHEFETLVNDPELDVVVETIGGVGVALTYTQRLLAAGKSVVTSNKELVATHGYELLNMARENHVSYFFEASVGGGIPIIRPIHQCLAANNLNEIAGILNGTTNYILTRMIQAGIPFETALQEAQANGYAEQDPSADINGDDACRKICILAALSFGRHIYPDQVPTEGITKITLSDVAFARSGNLKIKLLGRAIYREDGKVCAFVAPHLVPMDSPLANVEDVFNAIAIRGDAIGEVMFYGRGAGKLPTASAVVADVMDAVRHLQRQKVIQWKEGGPDAVYPLETVASRWYVRVAGSDLPQVGVTVLSNSDAPGEGAFLTNEELTSEQLKNFTAGMKVLAAYRVLPRHPN